MKLNQETPMKTYLVHLSDQPDPRKTPQPKLADFLSERQWISVFDDIHNNTYGTIQSEESPEEILRGMQPFLFPLAHARLAELHNPQTLPPWEARPIWIADHTSQDTWISIPPA